MNQDADAIVHAFNNCINRGDLDGLGALMTEDHRFSDAASHTVSGKQSCLEAWKSFFSAFPDYRNRFDRTIVRGNEVIILGSSSCSDDRLAGPAIWRARLSGEQIEEWSVLDDTKETRDALAIPE